jgi:hypothetical protein
MKRMVFYLFVLAIVIVSWVVFAQQQRGHFAVDCEAENSLQTVL